MRRAHTSSVDLEAALAEGEVTLDDTTAHRFRRVLRLKAGDTVELFGGGVRVQGRLAEGDPLKVVALERLDATLELSPLIVAQAMTKSSKLEDVVRRASELGAAEVLLFVAARTQGREQDARRTSNKVERLQRVAEDASRQCGRSEICRVRGPIAFVDVVQTLGDYSGVSAFGVLSAKEALSDVLSRHREVLESEGMLVVVGPEGGLSPAECSALERAGALGVRLAAHTLRTETAGLAALACAQVCLGSL